MNVYYGVQDSNQANQAVINQNGLNNYSQMQQVGDSTGEFNGSPSLRGDGPRYGGQNYASVTQNGVENSSQITQMGGTNVAAVAQNSHVGNGSTPRVLVPTDGPIYQSYQTAGRLSLSFRHGQHEPGDLDAARSDGDEQLWTNALTTNF